jgi:hypothetical protein
MRRRSKTFSKILYFFCSTIFPLEELISGLSLEWSLLKDPLPVAIYYYYIGFLDVMPIFKIEPGLLLSL